MKEKLVLAHCRQVRKSFKAINLYNEDPYKNNSESLYSIYHNLYQVSEYPKAKQTNSLMSECILKGKTMIAIDTSEKSAMVD